MFTRISPRAEANEIDAKNVRGDGRENRFCPVGEMGVRGSIRTAGPDSVFGSSVVSFRSLRVAVALKSDGVLAGV